MKRKIFADRPPDLSLQRRSKIMRAKTILLFINFCIFLPVLSNDIALADNVTIPPKSTDIVWQKCIGGTNEEAGHCVQLTSDGGCIIAGYTASRDGDITINKGKKDFLVVKLDSKGKVQWLKTYGDVEDDIAYSIGLTSDGGYIVAGATNYRDTVQYGYHGSSDYWILKLTSSGALQWEKCFGGNGEDVATCVQQTTDGGYIVVGTSNSKNGDVENNFGGSDVWLIKLDDSGTLQWNRTIGRRGYDMGYGVQQTSEGGFIVGGKIDSDPGETGDDYELGDLYTAYVDASGTVQWGKFFGGIGDDNAYCVRQTSDGGYIAVGNIGSLGADCDHYHAGDEAWAVKVTATGSFEWEKHYGGTGDDIVYNARQTSDDGYILAGETESYNGEVSDAHHHSGTDAWLIKLNSQGAIEWQKCYGGGGNDIAYDVRPTSDGGYVFVGKAGPLKDGDIASGSTGPDLWIVKIHP